jgi:nucleoside-diphosphate-sugar epimerase
MDSSNMICKPDNIMLITGSNGFIGTRLVEALLIRGFTNLRCFVRPSSNLESLHKIIDRFSGAAQVDIFVGTLLSQDDCDRAAEGTSVIFQLAAGIGKSYSGCFLNSVVSTRNLLNAAVKHGCLKRFVNISSFAVYSNDAIKRGGMLDESCAIENPPTRRQEATATAKSNRMSCSWSMQAGTTYLM